MKKNNFNPEKDTLSDQINLKTESKCIHRRGTSPLFYIAYIEITKGKPTNMLLPLSSI